MKKNPPPAQRTILYYNDYFKGWATAYVDADGIIKDRDIYLGNKRDALDYAKTFYNRIDILDKRESKAFIIEKEVKEEKGKRVKQILKKKRLAPGDEEELIRLTVDYNIYRQKIDKKIDVSSMTEETYKPENLIIETFPVEVTLVNKSHAGFWIGTSEFARADQKRHKGWFELFTFIHEAHATKKFKYNHFFISFHDENGEIIEGKISADSIYDKDRFEKEMAGIIKSYGGREFERFDTRFTIKGIL